MAQLKQGEFEANGLDVVKQGAASMQLAAGGRGPKAYLLDRQAEKSQMKTRAYGHEYSEARSNQIATAENAVIAHTTQTGVGAWRAS